jgi:hypothetical protein
MQLSLCCSFCPLNSRASCAAVPAHSVPARHRQMHRVRTFGPEDSRGPVPCHDPPKATTRRECCTHPVPRVPAFSRSRTPTRHRTPKRQSKPTTSPIPPPSASAADSKAPLPPACPLAKTLAPATTTMKGKADTSKKDEGR